MKINRAQFPSLATAVRAAFVTLSAGGLAALSGCVAPRTQPAPAPPPAPPPPRAVPAPVAGPPPADWRDAPQTPGNWQYLARAGGGEARYLSPGGDILFAMRCEPARSAVVLARAGSATAPLPMSLVTTSEVRPLSAAPAPSSQTGRLALEVTVPVRDGLLDAMAFSRGRFAVEVNGLPTLYLPAWPEVGRVVEDCR